MLKEPFYISRLIAGYLKGELSEEQAAELNAWIAASPENSSYLSEQFGTEERLRDLLVQYNAFDEDAVWNKTLQKLETKKRYPFSYKIIAAAMLLIVGSVALLWFSWNTREREIVGISRSKDIPAGTNGATLTLGDGRRISLSDALEGKLAEESGTSIVKTTDGQVLYHTKGIEAQGGEQSFNTLTTSKGQQYQLILPDQTKAWLNAGSSVRYPASFAGLKARKVEITGEVYFEVAKTAQRVPFLVSSKNQTVEVLGTHFNINAYDDEPVIKTTLLEGSVNVLSLQKARLRPGEQSALTPAGKIQVNAVNTAGVVAWKNGDFVLRDTDFDVLMRKIARWYNVEIVYTPSAPSNLKLVGVVSRSKNISAILKVIEATGEVHFEIEGRRVTVTK
ncbi:FecR domain-containing protein [Pedobacter deserti]|uniref:FecR domain-containing protein n=1 Tax=Pedobacter deserti TaxID=2817382 RepID=UPI00210C35F7|nr:FecR domain-containing protein [Pedobacter sp. SYSU D00382]